MGTFKELFQAIPTDVFNTLTGVPISITYRVVDTVYTPGTGPVNTNIDYETRCIQDDITSLEIGNGMAKTEDVKLLIAATELEVIPKPKDQILFKERWHTIESITTDPADALWEVIARE